MSCAQERFALVSMAAAHQKLETSGPGHSMHDDIKKHLQRCEPQSHAEVAHARRRVRDKADRQGAVRPRVATVHVASEEEWLPNGKNCATELPTRSRGLASDMVQKSLGQSEVSALVRAVEQCHEAGSLV